MESDRIYYMDAFSPDLLETPSQSKKDGIVKAGKLIGCIVSIKNLCRGIKVPILRDVVTKLGHKK